MPCARGRRNTVPSRVHGKVARGSAGPMETAAEGKVLVLCGLGREAAAKDKLAWRFWAVAHQRDANFAFSFEGNAHREGATI